MRRSVLDPIAGALGARDPMFTAGFGDPGALAGRLERAWPLRDAADTEIAIQGTRRRGDLDVHDATFPSPCSDDLPVGAGTARLRWLAPARATTGRAIVVLAASREEGFAWRERIWGPLAREQGVDVLLLENPYYGARRAPGQRSASLATVADQLRMNLATIGEVAWLLRWLGRARPDARVAVTGFSMGGAIAALVGALVREDRPFAVVPVAAGLSPAPIYTVGLLARSVAWSALAREAGGTENARRTLAELLDHASLGRLPSPVSSDAAIVVGCTRDGFVPRVETEALARHWRAELRWIEGGHVSGLALGARVMRRAVTDALARL